MTKPLPSVLEKEPLVDALFEVRLGGNPHMADILPGILFGKLDKPTFQRLPAAQIPQPIRAIDPNMVFAPTIRLDWKEYVISLGDKNAIVSCKIPYPKWPSFKKAILHIAELIAETGIVGPVERYSMKYVNLIPAASVSSQIEKINMSIRLGDVEVQNDHVSLQVQQQENRTLHLITIVTNAQAHTSGNLTTGVIVDIDSIRTVQYPDFKAFLSDLPTEIESLRYSNKRKFFDCLKESTTEEMGPRYD